MSTEHTSERNEDFSEWTGEAFDIDKEWEDINAHLEKAADITSGDVHRLTVQDRLAGIVNEVLLQSRDYDMVRLVDADDEWEVELEREHFERIRTGKIQEHETWSNRPLSEQELAVLSIDSLIQFYEEKEFQIAFMHLAANLIHAERYPEDAEASPIYMSFLKKQMQALAFVYKEWGPNNGWQQLLDDVSSDTQGLGFYQDGDGKVAFAVAADEGYVDDAKASHPQYRAESRKRHWLIHEALRVTGIDTASDDEDKVLDYTVHLLNMLDAATKIVVTQNDHTSRLDRLWWFSRKLELDDNTLSRLVEIFDAAYPPEFEAY